MHDADADNDWMAGLDWSRHRRAGSDWVSEHLMLSGVVDVFARAFCAPYPETIDHFIGQAQNTPPGPIVEADEAFTEAGEPVHSVHARLSALMRRHADDLSIGIVAADAITRDEWERIIEAGRLPWSIGQGARRAVAGLAPVIARMARAGEIRCFIRRVGGGELRPLDREAWEIDYEAAVRRIAACGLAEQRPFDPSAGIDHLIFVDRDLHKAVIRNARQSYVPVAGLELGPWAMKRKVDHYAIQVREVAEFLASLMTDERLGWTNRDFQAAVQDRFGVRGLGRCYEKARQIATEDESRRRFRKRRRTTA
ncbi:hypothetical protein [Sphingomonas adhaesiva]|uniref:Uncharacterized protein n=1 Tax=Sphingomonas adhaesiva TaxID=28212 RepID=A0A2A4IB64_9SPHN|nr:hypothetical protein [Sphingomonas adhaesiva]PCG15759.1 hypothetical protein COA07_01905 [Sphingomonas adhaesiva]